MPVTLLLADDSATIQRVIEMTFADEDVRVVTAGDGREAMERIAADAPDIVLADAGYASEDDFKALEGMAIDAYVSLGREGRKPPEQLAPARRRMAQKLGTPEGRRTYANRKHIAEPPFGWIKQVLGFRRFSFRGLEKVRGEWDLVCLALNARRIGASRA